MLALRCARSAGAAAADRPAPRPDRIGPYQILDVLGEGGMGTVYLAEQREPVSDSYLKNRHGETVQGLSFMCPAVSECDCQNGRIPPIGENQDGANPMRRLLSSLLILSSASFLADGALAQSGRCRGLGGGCTGGRVPMMRCSGLPNVGCSQFGLLLSNLGFSFPTGVTLLGACSAQPVPISPPTACGPGCQLHVTLGAVALPFQADRFGIAFVALPVPNEASLVGVRFCAQAVRVDATCLSLTEGIEIRLGRGSCR